MLQCSMNKFCEVLISMLDVDDSKSFMIVRVILILLATMKVAPVDLKKIKITQFQISRSRHR